jgi:hypothetical protein
MFELLYGDDISFDSAWRIASRAEISGFDDIAIRWLAAVYRQTSDEKTAFDVAQAPDQITMYPAEGKLQIHGHNIEIKKTPLAYYAWYAIHRVDDEGWIKNPQSTTPDKLLATDIKKWLDQWDCHAKAWSSIQDGVKAKTLDQNRSKIREALLATIGDDLLVFPYLFEERKNERFDVNEYRLRFSPSKIRIIK